MFENKKLALFRTKLTEKIDFLEHEKEVSQDLQLLQKLEKTLNKVSEVGDRRDNA